MCAFFGRIDTAQPEKRSAEVCKPGEMLSFQTFELELEALRPRGDLIEVRMAHLQLEHIPKRVVVCLSRRFEAPLLVVGGPGGARDAAECQGQSELSADEGHRGSLIGRSQWILASHLSLAHTELEVSFRDSE